MLRKIINFEQDVEQHWVAVLDCCHGQHVRHQPPFTERPWTQSASGRQRMLDTTLDCVKCERLELPERVVEYRATPVFDEQSVPAGLLRDHKTKSGVWGRIRIYQGQLRYHVTAPFQHTQLLDQVECGIIVPEALHYIEPVGELSFRVEFLRCPDHA